MPFGEELGAGIGGRTTGMGYSVADGLRQKFTQKERDNETGLDYFGARYMSNIQGRFTSPDPLLNSARPDAPETWNRYAYTRNNPLNKVDPNGLYDLNNTCGANDKRCNQQFNQHAKSLQKGLEKLQKALAKVKDPTQKARLENSLKAFGTAGDHNGVTVTFGANKDGAAGNTDTRFNDATNKLEFNVTLDPSKINGSDDYAVDSAHEGTHIADIKDPRYADEASTLSDFSKEYRGYQTSAWATEALGYDSLSYKDDKGNNYVIWNRSWGKVDDKVLTKYVTTLDAKSRTPTHQETTPHNPWKD